MAPRGGRLLKAVHPEGIPWPFACLYSTMSRRGIFQRHYERVAQDIAGYRREGRLLDIGTGPGWLLLKLHAIAPELRLTGLDISPAMVTLARKHVAQAGAGQAIEIVEAPANRLPFPDGAFDLVVSTGALHHWKDPTGGLNECFRVLSPGGVGLMYDLVATLPEPVAAAAKREFGRFRMWLLWLHSFEEPFYSSQEMTALAAPTRFGAGQTKFVGVLCCLVLRKPPEA